MSYCPVLEKGKEKPRRSGVVGKVDYALVHLWVTST